METTFKILGILEELKLKDTTYTLEYKILNDNEFFVEFGFNDYEESDNNELNIIIINDTINISNCQIGNNVMVGNYNKKTNEVFNIIQFEEWLKDKIW